MNKYRMFRGTNRHGELVTRLVSVDAMQAMEVSTDPLDADYDGPGYWFEPGTTKIEDLGLVTIVPETDRANHNLDDCYKGE